MLSSSRANCQARDASTAAHTDIAGSARVYGIYISQGHFRLRYRVLCVSDPDARAELRSGENWQDSAEIMA